MQFLPTIYSYTLNSMQRIFLPPEQITKTEARITGADHLHLARVLRMRAGEAVTVLDGQGNAFHAVLVSIGKSDSVARIEGRVEAAPEPPVHLTVVQALGKGDKFEQVVQHGTEAGASAFVPLRAERCIGDVPAAKAQDKVARWQQIAKSAAEQSGRVMIPAVGTVLNFAQLLAAAKRQELITGDMTPFLEGAVAKPRPKTPPLIMLHTDPSAMPLKGLLQSLATPYFLAFAIGPEGGWSGAEIEAAQQADIPFVTLGPRVLRTETAALVAISQILYHYETG